ncbi:MAG: response regulator [Burkholderiales bacterium]|nr:response regulator [Burkholderiales bacterium]
MSKTAGQGTASQPELTHDAEREALVRADLARHLKRGEPLRIVGNGLVAITVAVLMRDVVPLPWVLAWLAAMLGHAAFNAWAAWRVWRRPTRTEAAARRLRVVTRMEAANGLLWMAAELLWLPGSDYVHRGLIMVLLSGLGAGVMHSLSAHLPALYAFSLPIVLGFFVAGCFAQGTYFLVAFALLLVWLAVNLNFASHMNRTLRESLANHHRAQALAVDLQVQRDRAVELGQARSRFLAAASHDLRQPVHALSLFVGALQLEPRGDKAAIIMGHVDGALAALGSLFDALLDISKLDAGLVQPDWQPLPLRQFLQRLAQDQAALASAKGLRFELRTHGDASAAEAWVRSDPVLLERVLRNLLANALRYTDHGCVQLQLRLRGGRAEIKVADTGRGIPQSRRREVFEEFVQLGGPEGGREQGMGLGLSIVARLVGLLDLQLRLRSRLDRGTVVCLMLPLLPAPVVSPEPRVTPASGSALSGLQPGDVVLVIDDSDGVRLAMQELLANWGCEVFAAPDIDTLMPQLMTLSTPPRLLLCDYQLRAGANGLDAIDRLRDAFNDELAAVLITGDTAPDRLRQAAASGLPLLHKPVTPSLLRQAINRALLAAEPGIAIEPS